MKLAFILTMPCVGSWNGDFSGKDKIRCKTRTVPQVEGKKLLETKSFSYRWDDGWVAKIEVFKATEKRSEIRKSVGFLGYDWMIDSILVRGEISPIRNY